MNRFGLVLSLAVLGLSGAMAPEASAARVGDIAFSGTSTDVSTTLTYKVVSILPAGAPRITHIDATSDKAASVLQFYCTTNNQTITNASSGATNKVYLTTTGFASNDVVVIWFCATDKYQRTRISANITAGELTLAENTDYAVGTSDIVYKMTPDGSLVVGATTKNYNGAGGLYFGQEGKPLLVELDGTAACQINVLAGDYIRSLPR